MKTKLLLAALVGLFFTTFSLAQDAASAAPISPDAQNFVLGLMQSLVLKYPVLATVITILGSMRLWAKPVSGIVHSIIDLTPTKWDDGLWNQALTFFTVSPVGKFLAYMVDWFLSIKLQKQVTVQPQLQPPGV